MKKILAILFILASGPADAKGIFCAMFGACLSPEAQRRLEEYNAHNRTYSFYDQSGHLTEYYCNDYGNNTSCQSWRY